MSNPKTRKVGLARTLSKLGYCSRSKAAELIRGGRVTLNGRVRRDPEYPVSAPHDEIRVDGQSVGAKKKIYLMLNKPPGVVTTASDEKGRSTVYECLEKNTPWVAPVGRLDQASEGLLLLTNDSEWGARITEPKTHLNKIYHVRIDAKADETLITKLLAGVTNRGEELRVKSAEPIRGGSRRAWIEIALDEGKNRHIRRMFEELGIEVLRLVRVAVGPLYLGELKKGSSRELTSSERKQLDQAMEQSSKS